MSSTSTVLPFLSESGAAYRGALHYAEPGPAANRWNAFLANLAQAYEAPKPAIIAHGHLHRVTAGVSAPRSAPGAPPCD
jgi:hypothetical protein